MSKNPFSSFWMAGFECSDQQNTHGDRVDFLHLTSHLALIDADYAMLSQFQMRVVREGVRWSQVETLPYQYDFTTVAAMLAAGRRSGVQQVWDLCHFGYPDDLSPLHPHFSRRFEDFCTAFAQFYKKSGFEQPLIVTPINEVSFISWLGGDVAATSPFCRNNGWEVKYALMRAYIKGIEALKRVDPDVRILTTEPLVSVTSSPGSTDQQQQDAAFHHELQFQVLDILSGRMCPELGGKEEYLDLLGFNYYYDNQWILEPYRVLGWRDAVPDANYRSLTSLLMDVYNRYNKPVLLSETSHPGIDRPLWIQYIAEEVLPLLQNNVPFWGICVYPVIDRPDWDDTSYWHQSGLWDFTGEQEGLRVLHQPFADVLKKCQHSLDPVIKLNQQHKVYEQVTANSPEPCIL